MRFRPCIDIHNQLGESGKTGACSRKGTSGSGSELSEKRRTILYRDRPLAEIYTGTRIGTDD